MPRTPRVSQCGNCHHVLNRGNGRRTVFHKDGDFAAFRKLLCETGQGSEEQKSEREQERTMRAGTFVCAVAALALVAGVGNLPGNSGEAAKSDRVAALIKQLGDEEFARREAASRELEDMGEPALAALRKAAASSDDLEIRQRADRIIQAIATRAADAAITRQLAAFEGKWNVEFTNGVKEVCRIRKDRTASVAEPLRTSSATVEIKDGSIVIVYRDDRVERWTPVGKRMIVEHWHPGAPFPSGTPVLGIADGAR